MKKAKDRKTYLLVNLRSIPSSSRKQLLEDRMSASKGAMKRTCEEKYWKAFEQVFNIQTS